ncbi:MAG: hypothetical protein HDT47_04870 [Ruminococcaceae bacterium]|nr:hypothetical protein [Oscillospiraceae bacterium]
MTVKAHLVGSGSKNLITQNANDPVDLDYNLCVVKVSKININDGKAIKEYIRKRFNEVLQKNELNDCQDSKSALTTKKMRLSKGNKTEFHIDLAIIRETPSGWARLIHEKIGTVIFDRWYWNEARNSKDLAVKANDIKKKDMWEEVRKIYLEKKNMYLCNRDHDHPSFIVYIETINEIHNKLFR